MSPRPSTEMARGPKLARAVVEAEGGGFGPTLVVEAAFFGSDGAVDGEFGLGVEGGDTEESRRRGRMRPDLLCILNGSRRSRRSTSKHLVTWGVGLAESGGDAARFSESQVLRLRLSR